MSNLEMDILNVEYFKANADYFIYIFLNLWYIMIF